MSYDKSAKVLTNAPLRVGNSEVGGGAEPRSSLNMLPNVSMAFVDMPL